MDHYFRIGLCFVFFLLFSGQLQTAPLCPTRVFKHLSNLQCGANMTSPTNVERHCLGEALKTFKQGLKHAQHICSQVDENARINDTLDVVQNCFEEQLKNQKKSTDCSWEGEEFIKPFAEFVKDIEDFIHYFNTLKTKH